jgi:Zn-finger nucleic acid-binding protein
MRPVLVDGVEIDRCSRCRGVWLDAGEYDAVAAAIQSDATIPDTPQVSSAPKSLDVGSPVWEMAEFVLFVASELL